MKLSKHADASHFVSLEVIDIFDVAVGLCGKTGDVNTAVESNLKRCKRCLEVEGSLCDG